MKVHRYLAIGRATFSSAGIFLSDNVGATSSIDSPSIISTGSFPVGCVTEHIANGYCDLFNNIEDCGGYDGGDCCECTCVSTESYECGAGHHGGYPCIDPSAECVDVDDGPTNPEDEDYPDSPMTHGQSYSHSMNSLGCIPGYISDGYCDEVNNNDNCGFDGGDCCGCTSVSSEVLIRGTDSTYHRMFACLDPSAPCADDDDFDAEDYKSTFLYVDNVSERGLDFPCLDKIHGNGNCDSDNNIDECGFDGGDCCECDCVSTEEYTCGGNSGYDCVDQSSSCNVGYVLAETKTTISVSANAFDTRPSGASGDDGCGEDGCSPELSIDGIIHDLESRWSCEQGLVFDGQPCQIEFVFGDPQDIIEVQVAFWKGDERSRTLEAAINGEVIGDFDSYAGSRFNALGIQGVGVHTLTLKHVGVADSRWISLAEVRFLVEP